MKKQEVYLLIGFLVLIGLAFIFTQNRFKDSLVNTLSNLKNPTNTSRFNQTKLILFNRSLDCSKTQTPNCFLTKMPGCIPSKLEINESEKEIIEIKILGLENESCHFQKKVNNVSIFDCYFSMEILNSSSPSQTKDNYRILQGMIDSPNCNIV